MIYHDSLQQNATDIISKCDGYFIAKYDRSLLQMRQVSYYKMRQLLQIATILITKCDIYYKMPRLLQIATVRSFYLFLPLNWYIAVFNHTLVVICILQANS